MKLAKLFRATLDGTTFRYVDLEIRPSRTSYSWVGKCNVFWNAGKRSTINAEILADML